MHKWISGKILILKYIKKLNYQDKGRRYKSTTILSINKFKNLNEIILIDQMTACHLMLPNFNSSAYTVTQSTFLSTANDQF